MLEAFAIPIRSAVLIFPFIAVGIFVPLCVLHYRRWGYVHGNRMFVLYSFLFFLLTAFFLVILPLPIVDEGFCEWYRETKTPQLIPFNFINDILEAGGGSRTNLDLRALVDNPPFFQAFFNFLLLLPMGVYLRYYFDYRMHTVIGIAFALTLVFEVTQLTGIYGIYPCPYRLFDVDDLLLNTAGSIVGYAITPLLAFLPNIHAKPKSIPRVTIMRRFVAFVTDLTLLSLFSGLIFAVSHLVLGLMGRSYPNTLAFWVEIIPTLLYFVVFPKLTRGYTFGKWLVRIRIVNMDDEPPSLLQLVQRYLILLYLVPIFEFLMLLTTTYTDNAAIVLFVTLPFLAVSLLHPIFVYGLALIRQDNRGFHDFVAGTTHQAHLIATPFMRFPLYRLFNYPHRSLTEDR